MNTEDEKMLDWVEFVTDKFEKNHQPWKYTRDTGTLEHIRYSTDRTGWNQWQRRLKRFIRNSTVGHWKPDNFERRVSNPENFTLWSKIRRWPMMVRVHWNVQMKLDNNLPDGQVNGIPTHWEEDGEYITMFCPYVGREVLKFLRAEPNNPFAQEILRAMRETQEISWPKTRDKQTQSSPSSTTI